MRTFLIKTTCCELLFILFLAFTKPVSAIEGITFSFANSQITGTGPYYFEFDVMAVATANTQFKLAQIYIDYNTVAFGSDISGTANLIVTKGSVLLANTVGPGGDFGSYTLTTANNSTSKLAIQNTWAKFDNSGGDTGFDLTNTLGTTALVYAHVKILIQNTTESSGLSFDATVSQFDQQQYYFTDGDNEAQYSPVSVGSGLDVALPVELTSFNANVDGNKVNLLWQTATELNNYGFDVERKSQTESWSKIGFVPGHGNSNSIKNYVFTDNNISGTGKLQYRLKQIDNDGTFKYSDVTEVNIATPEDYALEQNYPNPFNPSTLIKFSLPKPGFVKLKVYNLLGQDVVTLVNKYMNEGTHKVNLDMTGYPSGVYIYKLDANGFSDTKKMIYLR